MADSDQANPPLRWARILGVVLAAFLLVEAGSQAAFVLWTGRPFNSVFLYQWSPYGLVRNNPDLTGNFTISRDGFREVRTYERQKPPNTLRVLLMGGSVLYAGSTPVNSLPGYVPSDRTISQYMTAYLKADPAFAGVNVEVINAGVNFNMIREVSSAYLADYIHWSPDMIVVFGSANNFPDEIPAGAFAAGHTPLQEPHLWRYEFERLVNERSAGSAVEGAFRHAADASASLAILHKALTRTLIENDPAAWLPRPSVPPKAMQGPPPAPASIEEEGRYFDLYSSYAAAMIAAARRSGQEVAFVWEYHLGDLGGIKPMSPEELTLYPAARRKPEKIAFDRRMQARLAAFLAEQDAVAVDPLEALKRSPQTVFNDYLHYTAGGNAVVARAAYEQLRDRLLQDVASRTSASPAPVTGP